MNQSNRTLQAKVLQLRMSFAGQLPKRLAELEKKIQRLIDEKGNQEVVKEELFHAFHSLKGASLSFGFDDLARVAEMGEQIIHDLISVAPFVPDDKRQALVEVYDNLSQQVSELKDADLSVERSFRSPSFEMKQVHLGWHKRSAPLVYVCDDEKIQAQQLSYQLKCFGYRVEFFTELNSFEAAVIEQRPDAVIMDVHFPSGAIAGTEMLRRINEANDWILPSIVLSGHNSFEGRLSAFRAGCRSYFTKPVRPLELASALDELLKTDGAQPLRVLIVDDEPEIAAYHSLILEEAGILVKQVHDPSQVLEVLASFAPDLVLVDVYMPQCTGLELAGIIRMVPEYLSMPILYLSSEMNLQKQHKAMQVGVEGFITKPVVPDELASAVILRAERMRSLRRLMTHDSLTGLYNHSSIKEIIENTIKQANRSSDSLVLVMLDLDMFKQVNDYYGHLAGDQVLVALARMLKHRLRATDIIGRYGGEEFVILLRKVTLNEAFTLIDTLREDFSKIAFSSGTRDFNCTFSAGLSALTEQSSIEALINAADVALYQAKSAGRNRVMTDAAASLL